jgi:hypothetical protein
MSAGYYNKDGSSKNAQVAHFSGATGERVTVPSGVTSHQQYFKGIADDLKNVPESEKREKRDKISLDFNKGGKRRKTRRNKRKSRGRKSRRRISRRR